MEALHIVPHGGGAAGNAKLLFHLGQRGLAVLDRVPHPLAGDAVVLGNLSQGEVIVIIL